MEKISIKSIGTNFFKVGQKKNNNQQATQTNPFGLSFRGNVIQADVFETTKVKTKDSLKDKVINKGKTYVSTIVGSYNSLNNEIRARFNNAISFGRKIRDNVSSFLNKPIEIDLGINKMVNTIKEKFANPYSQNTLVKKPVKELEEMLRNEIQIEKGIA